MRGADGIITCWTGIPDTVLLENPDLRYLGFWTNLVDHRVNLTLAQARGITVDYVPDYGTDSVAEMTFTPLCVSEVGENLVVICSSIKYVYGTFSGRVTDEKGLKTEFTDIKGMIEWGRFKW